MSESAVFTTCVLCLLPALYCQWQLAIITLADAGPSHDHQRASAANDALTTDTAVRLPRCVVSSVPVAAQPAGGPAPAAAAKDK